MGILFKKVHNILLCDAGQFYVKKQDGGRIKICETFSRNSLKEDLSIDTTFDPCYFSWDSPFKKAKKNSGIDFGNIKNWSFQHRGPTFLHGLDS